MTNVAAMLSLYIRCLSGPRVVYASKTSLSETVADRQYSTVLTRYSFFASVAATLCSHQVCSVQSSRQTTGLEVGTLGPALRALQTPVLASFLCDAWYESATVLSCSLRLHEQHASASEVWVWSPAP